MGVVQNRVKSCSGTQSYDGVLGGGGGEGIGVHPCLPTGMLGTERGKAFSSLGYELCGPAGKY